MARHGTRDRILTRARGLLAKGGNPTVDQLAHVAGVSKSSFYRAFGSRQALFAELEVAPEPGSRDRILEAALAMVGSTGLAALSMDELAERAQVSRATLYRLFPGKSSVFTSLLYAYSPLEAVTALLASRSDEPPDVVMPEVARAVYHSVFGGRESRLGLIRTVFFEVSGLAPDTEEAAREVIGRLLGSLAMYLMTQMSAGRLRPMSTLLALQSFIGPIFFHLMTRPVAQRVLGMEIDGEQAVTELADTWLRAMRAA
ncbi:MAG: TetR/AcrR family transcriptional regulator [Candidatus Dormibacterales bacterium]